MTTHPIDTEALLDRLRRNAQAPMDRVERLNGMGGSPEYGDDERPFPDEMLELLDLLAAAEHRATRAEAQSAIRGRAVIIYRDRAREAEARIKAVRDVHRKWTVGDPCDKRRGCGGADCAPHVNGYGDKVWRHWRDDCTGCAATWPCPTTRALDGDA